ncbi:MAG TPA: sodium:proline symporter, partial [Thermoanaerobaculia bacterium]|nr:sodium:proline symporter [Thermoanaerobaculia bacterium]
AVTTAVWLAVTFATRPESPATLDAFYRKVRPAGPGWKPVAERTGLAPPPGEIGRNALLWVLGIVFVYAIMFSTGGLIFGQRDQAVIFGVLLVGSGGLLIRMLAREPR